MSTQATQQPEPCVALQTAIVRTVSAIGYETIRAGDRILKASFLRSVQNIGYMLTSWYRKLEDDFRL